MNEFIKLNRVYNKRTYTINDKLLRSLNTLLSTSIDDTYPIRLKITIDAGKQWAFACIHGLVIHSTKSLRRSITQYQMNLFNIISNEYDNHKVANKLYKRHSGNC